MSCNDILNCAELQRLEKLIKKNEREVYSALLKQDTKIAELACKFNGEIQKAIAEYLRYMEQEGKLAEIITDTLLNDVAILINKTASIVNAREFGATGNGVCDDTKAIQAAIDHANANGRTVYLPKGTYMISKPIRLNGCSLIGEVGNIFASTGTVIVCAKNDFIAIKQGSTKAADIMFNISDITVSGAEVGFEIVYAINSKYERLYAVNCGTGYKIGDPAAVGCMFCEFNNLYTQNCEIGIESHSSTYMNNNRFNNGYIKGTDYAMRLSVIGGYGAVGNVFNNVEFRSETGRGVELQSCINTVFNSCYFECGGNALRLLNYCSVALNNGTYAIYNPANTFRDLDVIHTVGGGDIAINGGTVFLTENYFGVTFLGVENAAILQNVKEISKIHKNGSATGFRFYPAAIHDHEQAFTTATIDVPANGAAVLEFTYETPFAAVPQIVSVTMRGAAGAEKGLSYLLAERTATGGKISITNDSTGLRSVSFSVYAKSV